MDRIDRLGRFLLEDGEIVEVPTWQSLDVRESPQGRTIEVRDETFRMGIPGSRYVLASEVQPNLPWAENHFQERVRGEPLNPGETYKEWPWYRGNVETHKSGGRGGGKGQFSHTYMERFWPRKANRERALENVGIRYPLGDLNDLINLLLREPQTRQAYLPVWFPEDTGAVPKERVPCTLGYLFMMRNNQLHLTYYIRSCDYLRHLKDDVYLACRLCQWVLDKLVEEEDGPHLWEHVVTGELTMHIGSLHIFEGDLPAMRRQYGSNG